MDWPQEIRTRNCSPTIRSRWLRARSGPDGIDGILDEFIRKRLKSTGDVTCILAVLLAVCGCANGNRAFYPLGIYGVNNTNDLALVQAAGFNLVTGPATADYLEAARQKKLRVLANPGTVAGPNFDAAKARATVNRLDRHRSLWAWYLCDEPELEHVPPASVNTAHRFLKSLGASKPTALVLNRGEEAANYGKISDILMIDRYPIPWLPLANFGQHVRLARLGAGQRKPLVAVIQAFDWSSHPELMQGEANLRPPSYDELRCMTYLALAEGATGVFYYTFDDGRWRIQEHEETWNNLKGVVREVNERLPLFKGKRQWWPKDHRFQDYTNRFNAALESSINSVWLKVPHGNPTVPCGDFILAVNTTEKTQGYSLTLPFGVVSSVPVVGEGRSLAPERNWLTDRFEPFAVHVYGPLPKRSGDAENQTLDDACI